MELKEYYKILKANFSTAVYTIVILAVATYIWSIKQAESYSASLLLNVSRLDTQNTADYRYDQFYRIQADDKFSDTLSQWLTAPGIASEIIAKANFPGGDKTLRQLSRSFRGEKISPETVEVRFSATNPDEAKKIGDAIGVVIDEKTKNLNLNSQDATWFKVFPSNYIALKNIQNLPLNLGLASIVGLFFGVISIFFKHYFSEEEK
jgi:capsular polysaccharide biosynthesis protein